MLVTVGDHTLKRNRTYGTYNSAQTANTLPQQEQTSRIRVTVPFLLLSLPHIFMCLCSLGMGNCTQTNNIHVHADTEPPFTVRLFRLMAVSLFQGIWSGSVCTWRIRDGYLKIVMPREYVRCVAVNFSPNGRYIAALHMSGFLRIWDARTNQLLHQVDGPYETYLLLGVYPGRERASQWRRR
jgi:WD40 repeat protein